MAGAHRPPAWRRWLGIVLRCAHLAAVTLLGAHLLGAGGAAAHGGLLTLASGAALLVSELADSRLRATELAGLVALAKLALVGWMVAQPAHALAMFWPLLVLSALISHAPRELRHWPRRA